MQWIQAKYYFYAMRFRSVGNSAVYNLYPMIETKCFALISVNISVTLLINRPLSFRTYEHETNRPIVI
jgi:hypothetical protein